MASAIITNTWDGRGAGFWSVHCESIADALDFARRTPTKNENEWARLSGIDKKEEWEGTGGRDSREWRGVHSYREAEQVAQYGWPEGTAKVESLQGKLAGSVRASHGRQSWAFVEGGGLAPDITAYLANDPAHWLESRTNNAAGGRRVVTIRADVAVSCGIEAEAVARRGAAICAVVDAIESSGLRVRVIAADCVTRDNDASKMVGISFDLKAPDEPLDVARLAAMANPCLSRCIAFAMQECAPDEARQVVGVTGTGCYGRPASREQSIKAHKLAGLGDEEDTIFIDSDPALFESEKSCLDWIKKTAEAAGVAFED
jgi:hypothetical protein